MAWAQSARELVHHYSSAVFFVEARSHVTGDLGVGTAFHLGDGYFATARHATEGVITKVGRNDTSGITSLSAGGNARTAIRYPDFATTKILNIYHHPSDAVDVAVFQIERRDVQPSIQISPGADALTEAEYLMKEVVIMGYPPIPFATTTPLVVFRGEVSAVFPNRVDGKRHFVISGMARGGFSGGPVLEVGTPNHALGIICNSLIPTKNVELRLRARAGEQSCRGGETHEAALDLEELGFLSAISAETIFELAEHNHLSISSLESSKRGIVARGAHPLGRSV